MDVKKRSFLFNSVSAYLPFVVDLFLKILVIRVILLELGSELLGIWGILNAAMFFPLFLQQGLSFAVFVKASRAEGEAARQGFGVSLAFSGLVSLLMIFFAHPLSSFFRIPERHLAMSIIAFRITGAAFLFSSATSIFLHVLKGAGRFDVASLISGFSSLAESILCIAALKMGYQIISLVVIELCIQLFIMPLSLLLSRKTLGQWPLTFSFHKREIVGLLRESSGQLYVASCSRALWDLDPLIIPRFFGIYFMAAYWLGQRLAYAWRSFLWAGAWPAVPAITEAQPNENRMLRIHWLQVCLSIMSGIFLWYFADSIIYVWTGEANPAATISMRILVLAGLIDFLPATLFSSLYGQGKVFTAAHISLLAAIVKLIGLSTAVYFQDFRLLMLSTLIGALILSVGIFWAGAKQTRQSIFRFIQPILPATMASGLSLIVLNIFSKPQTVLQLISQLALYVAVQTSLLLVFLRFFFYPLYEFLVGVIRNFTGLKFSGETSHLDLQ